MGGWLTFPRGPVFSTGTHKTREGAAVSVFQKAAGLDQSPPTFPPTFPPRSHLIPKTELCTKIIHAHSLPLLEIAPKPCYKKFHPKYPNNIFVPRQTGPGRSCGLLAEASLPSLPAVAGRGGSAFGEGRPRAEWSCSGARRRLCADSLRKRCDDGAAPKLRQN